MMGVFIRLTAAGALAAVATFASGCAADPAVDASRAADAADTSATLAMPEAGALQEAEYAEQDQRAADEAAVRRTVERYYQLVGPSARSDRALSQRRLLFGPSCTPCVEGTRIAERHLESGARLQGGGVTAQILRVGLAGTRATTLAHVNYRGVRLKDKQGKTLAEEAPADFRDRLVLSLQPDGEWIIVNSRVERS
jgi:hypothetical protein